MLREYELMYIVRPELDDDGVRTATESIQSLIENIGGEVTKTTPWGKRRLAYEVQHLRDGHYVLLQLRLEGTRVTDLERALRISDTVFRHLLVVDESVAGVEDADTTAAEPASANGATPTAAASVAEGAGAAAGDDPAQSPAGTEAAAPGPEAGEAEEDPRTDGAADAEPVTTSAAATSDDEEV